MIGQERALQLLREHNLDVRPTGYYYTDEQLVNSDLGKALAAAPDEAGAADLLREVKQLKKLGIHPHDPNLHDSSREHLVKTTTDRKGGVSTVSIRKKQ